MSSHSKRQMSAYNANFVNRINKINYGQQRDIGMALVRGRLVDLGKNRADLKLEDAKELVNRLLSKKDKKQLDELEFESIDNLDRDVYMEYLMEADVLFHGKRLHNPVDETGRGIYVEGKSVTHMHPTPYYVWEKIWQDWSHGIVNTLTTIDSVVVRDYFSGHPAFVGKDHPYDTGISDILDKYAIGPVDYYIVPTGF